MSQDALEVPGSRGVSRGASVDSDGGGIKFEIGGGGEDSPAVQRRGRHLSEDADRRAGSVGPVILPSRTSGAARQHWIAAAPRGSLEIRSPAGMAAAQAAAAAGMGFCLYTTRFMILLFKLPLPLPHATISFDRCTTLKK